VHSFRGRRTLTNRTTQTLVHFSRPFQLPGFDAPQPAGEYRVDHDEESLEGHLRMAWLRTGSFIHLPAVAARGPTRQMVPIDPAELETALRQDIASS
jgi:hypothetical protein